MFQPRLYNYSDLYTSVLRLAYEDFLIFLTKRKADDPLESLVYYRREPNNENKFLNVLDVKRQGYGDCEDLAAWLLAYLWFNRIKAKPYITQQTERLYHVSVLAYTSNGWVEIDPSRILGM